MAAVRCSMALGKGGSRTGIAPRGGNGFIVGAANLLRWGAHNVRHSRRGPRDARGTGSDTKDLSSRAPGNLAISA
jgi:hypothetical protein